MNHYGFFNYSATLLTASAVSQGVLLVAVLPLVADNHWRLLELVSRSVLLVVGLPPQAASRPPAEHSRVAAGASSPKELQDSLERDREAGFLEAYAPKNPALQIWDDLLGKHESL